MNKPLCHLLQVSIINLSSRNHYLNITPSNVIALYQSRGTGLHRVNFHGSQDSLHSVLSALEKKALSETSSLNNSIRGTPNSLTGLFFLRNYSFHMDDKSSFHLLIKRQKLSLIKLKVIFFFF